MLAASLYIAACSLKNRTAMRLRRLREPRYLVGAVLGVGYFVFVFFVPRRAGRRGGRPGRGFPAGASAAVDMFGPSLAGLSLFLFAGFAWLFPSTSHLFAFTEAELAFLFPAPVSRRALLVHRLIRSQLGLLVAAMVPAFVFGGSRTIPVAERLFVGMTLWVLMVTARVYFAGITMARDHLGAADARARWTARAMLAVTLMALALVVLPLAEPLLAVREQSLTGAMAAIADATATGLPRLVLLPFRVLVSPFFADGAAEYVPALGGALVVLALAIAWVMKSDEIFGQASGDRAGGADAFRSRAAGGRFRRRPVTISAAGRFRGAGWTLPLTGRPEAAFFWKNALQTLRAINVRSLVPLIILIVYAVVGARFGMSDRLTPAFAFAALMVTAFTTLLGPGSVMSDLRGDLRHLELLKTWPVKAGAVLRGEMLWPGVLLSVCAWFALTCALILSASAFPRLTLAWRLSLYASAMLVIPAVIFAQYTIHEAAAVMFPGWIPPDNEMRGFESMAQRLILFGAIALAMAAMVGPPAIGSGLVAFAFYRLLGTPMVFVPAAAVCSLIVAIEIVVATEMLGPAYDRIDLSAVERVE